MTADDVPPGLPAEAADRVAATVALFDETAEAVRLLLRQVRAGEFGRLEELTREQANLRRALTAAILERQNAQRIRRDGESAAGDGSLDLGAARAEVGRRLARLRTANSGDAAGPPAEP